MFCRGKDPYCTSCATFPLSAKRKNGTTVQYGTFPLQKIGFLEGAHPIAAELTTRGLPGIEPQIVAVLHTHPYSRLYSGGWGPARVLRELVLGLGVSGSLSLKTKLLVGLLLPLIMRIRLRTMYPYLWEVFVWGFGVLFLWCACLSVSRVLFSVGVCACVTC